jgi:hypothetical protein
MTSTDVQPDQDLASFRSFSLAEKLTVPHVAEAVARLLVRETRARTQECVVWGGSAVMGVPGYETLPTILSQVTDLDAANQGVSAQSSSQVAARQGGRPAKFVIVGGHVPTEGAVKVAPLSISPVQEHWAEIDGAFGGIAGKLVRLDDKTHEFRRSEPGEPLACVEPVEFRSASEFMHESKIAIFWTGRGNYLEQDLIVADTQACVDRLGHDRFLIIGALNAKLPGHVEHDSVVELNAKLEAQFGRHFIDIRKFLIEHEQRRFLAREKRAGEVFELHNLAKRLRADLIHLNDLGNQLLSLVLASRLESMGIGEFPHIHSAFDQIVLTAEIDSAIATLDEAHDGSLARAPACAKLAATGAPIRLAQLGGCNLSDMARYVPGAHVTAQAVRSTMASLVAAPLDRSAYKVPACPLKAKFVEADFQKSFFDDFRSYNWDVLLLDLLREYLTASVRIGGSHVTEINHWVHGEPLEHADLFNVPYELIDWKHKDFFELWSRSAQTFYERLLKPALDEGRFVAMAEILPTWGEYRDTGEGFVVHPEHGQREYSAVLERMYAFFAALDSRIIRLKPEAEFAIGAFDTSSGVNSLHFIADFHARAGELLSAAMGIPPETITRHVAMERLRKTRSTYEARLAREEGLKRQLAAARHDAERAVLRAESSVRQLEHLQKDLRAARANTETARLSSEAQAEAIAALTARVAAEAADTERQRMAFLAREADLNAQITAHQEAFATLQREHEQLMDSFHEHIGHYDALREELERKNAADDETFALVLALATAVREFAGRHTSTLASGSTEASSALSELAGRMADVRKSLVSLQSAVTSAEGIGSRPALGDALKLNSSL